MRLEKLQEEHLFEIHQRTTEQLRTILLNVPGYSHVFPYRLHDPIQMNLLHFKKKVKDTNLTTGNQIQS